MAYVTTNPPKTWISGQGTGLPTLWVYTSTDVHTDVDAADYFSNGYNLGMKVGDVVVVSKSTTTIGTTLHYVTAVTANGAATVSAAILV